MTSTVADAGLLTVNGTIIAEIVAFLVMLGVLWRWVYPPVIKAATQRQDRIESALKDAEEARRSAQAQLEGTKQEVEEARNQAREILDRARRESAVEVEEARRRGKAEADALVERARDEIGSERDRAVQEIRRQVGTLVVTAAGRVLGQAIDASTHQRLIDESLESVGGESGSANGNGAKKKGR